MLSPNLLYFDVNAKHIDLWVRFVGFFSFFLFGLDSKIAAVFFSSDLQKVLQRVENQIGAPHRSEGCLPGHTVSVHGWQVRH